MLFKKYSNFIEEKKIEDKKDIEQAKVPQPKKKPSEPLACPKCGSSALPCACYIDDYYNAKLVQQSPRPNKIIKKKENE